MNPSTLSLQKLPLPDRDVRSWFSKPFDPPQVAPPDEGTGTHRCRWRPTDADRTDRPRHGLQVPIWVKVRAMGKEGKEGEEGEEGEDLTLLDLSDRASYHIEGIGAEC